jgi:hypothetical protein
MRFGDALEWYLRGQFTPADAERASGIAEGSQRTLQKARIFSPIPQARTARRLLFEDTVMRLSIAGELNRCGIQLIPASKIIYADPFLADFLLTSVDPREAFFEFDQNLKPVRRKNADPDGFFDPKKPVGPHSTDQFIEIVNGRYVFTKRTHDVGFILGELTPGKSDFILWAGSTYDYIEGKQPRPSLIDDSGLRAIVTKNPTRADQKAAKFARSNSISKITVNAGMALRAALRRLLFIDGAAESRT